MVATLRRGGGSVSCATARPGIRAVVTSGVKHQQPVRDRQQRVLVLDLGWDARGGPARQPARRTAPPRSCGVTVPVQQQGGEVGKAAGLPSGSIYPLLMRFEQAGCLTSDWEGVDPRAAGRPRRRLYQLTGQGAEVGRRALEEAQRELVSGFGRTPGFPLPGGTSA